MKNKAFIAMFSLVLAVAFAVTGACFGGDIKQRMKTRLPVIKQLKAKKIIGENNKGFLEFKTASIKGKNIVDAENADRRIVYGVIAKQQGTSPQKVGQRRAVKIAERAAPGVWLQSPDGKWYKK